MVTQSHPQEVRLSESFIHSFIQQIVTVCLLCTKTIFQGLGISMNKTGQNLSSHGIHILGESVMSHQASFTKWDKDYLLVCSLRQELLGKDSLRQLGKYLPGCFLRITHPLWPMLLGGEDFPHLGEALQFNNNSLRCF